MTHHRVSNIRASASLDLVYRTVMSLEGWRVEVRVELRVTHQTFTQETGLPVPCETQTSMTIS